MLEVIGTTPTGSDAVPIAVASGAATGTAVWDQPFGGPADITLAGGLSPYVTMAQAGNVWELEETEFDLTNDDSSSRRGLRGGVWWNAALSDNLSASVRFAQSSSFERRPQHRFSRRKYP